MIIVIIINSFIILRLMFTCNVLIIRPSRGILTAQPQPALTHLSILLYKTASCGTSYYTAAGMLASWCENVSALPPVEIKTSKISKIPIYFTTEIIKWDRDT